MGWGSRVTFTRPIFLLQVFARTLAFPFAPVLNIINLTHYGAEL